jgi:uncharacterized protein YfaS (alpha-2-macroglobulin family)
MIVVLRSRQNAEGAFGLWAANSHVVDYASVYAMHFLIEARERGRAVPADMLVSGNNWLRSLAASEGRSLADERTRAYAIYVLTRQGVVTTNFAAALQKRLEANHAKTYGQDIAAAYLAASYQLMKQQRLAERLIGNLTFGAMTGFETYYDPMGRDAQILFLLAKHFPERLPNLKPDTLETLIKPINHGNYNTYSSAQAILALDAYARVAEKSAFSNLTASEVLRDGTTRALTLPPTLMPRASFTPNAAKLRFGNKGELNAYWIVEQSGFDRGLPDKEIKEGFEVLREYVDADGKPVKAVKVGDEIEVRLKFRAINRSAIDNVALVDLLPGGFDLVVNPRPATPAPRNEAASARPSGNEKEEEGDEPEEAPEKANGNWRPSFGTARSTWAPEFADVREDRVVLYGSVGDGFQEFVYRIKATNIGTFTVPPAYGESMYERNVRARSLGAKITVEKR